VCDDMREEDFYDVGDYDPIDDDDPNEPVGSCDECDEDLYEDDQFFIDGGWLCGRCAWIAMGCPEPGDEIDSDLFDEEFDDDE
jgi:hypothetical protein